MSALLYFTLEIISKTGKILQRIETNVELLCYGTFEMMSETYRNKLHGEVDGMICGRSLVYILIRSFHYFSSFIITFYVYRFIWVIFRSMWKMWGGGDSTNNKISKLTWNSIKIKHIWHHTRFCWKSFVCFWYYLS